MTFFHSPNTRSTGVLTLLEELGADYDLHLLNMKAGEQRRPEYLAVNPMGKVPAIRHGDAVVTEQGAVYLYLADLSGGRPGAADRRPAARPVPALAVLLRLEFRAGGRRSRDEARARAAGDVALRRLRHDAGDADRPAGPRPFLLGERFTAADVLWGTALAWTTMFKLVPELPVMRAYIDRVSARPAVVRAKQKDAELAAAQAAS